MYNTSFSSSSNFKHCRLRAKIVFLCCCGTHFEFITFKSMFEFKANSLCCKLWHYSISTLCHLPNFFAWLQ